MNIENLKLSEVPQHDRTIKQTIAQHFSRSDMLFLCKWLPIQRVDLSSSTNGPKYLRVKQNRSWNSFPSVKLAKSRAKLQRGYTKGYPTYQIYFPDETRLMLADFNLALNNILSIENLVKLECPDLRELNLS